MTSNVVLCGNQDGLLMPHPIKHIPSAGPEVNFHEDMTYTDDIGEHFRYVDASVIAATTTLKKSA